MFDVGICIRITALTPQFIVQLMYEFNKIVYIKGEL